MYSSGRSIHIAKNHNFADQFSILLTAPDGRSLGPIEERLGPQRLENGNTRILIYYGKPSPYSRAQEVYFDFIPLKDYTDSGIWTFQLTPIELVTGHYDFWLPSGRILNPSTRFLRPVPETTLTIPSTASGVISVGAYKAGSGCSRSRYHHRKSRRGI